MLKELTMQFLDPRPTFASVLADDVSGPVLQWLTNKGIQVKADELKIIIVQSHLAGDGDAYLMARAINNVFKWPVDTSLVLILNAAIGRVKKFGHSLKVKEWVVKTGMRLQHKAGEIVSVIQGDKIIIGQLHVPLNDTAEAIIAIRPSKGQAGPMEMLKVGAECIIHDAPSLSAST